MQVKSFGFKLKIKPKLMQPHSIPKMSSKI